MATTKKDLINFISIRRKQMGGDTRSCCNMDSYIRDIQMTGYGNFIMKFADQADELGYSADISNSLKSAAHILLDNYEEVVGRCKKLNKVYRLLGNIMKNMEKEL